MYLEYLEDLTKSLQVRFNMCLRCHMYHYIRHVSNLSYSRRLDACSCRELDIETGLTILALVFILILTVLL